MDTSDQAVELHPRKRKIKHAKDASGTTSSSGSAAATNDKEKEKDGAESAAGSSHTQAQNEPPPMMNCYEMWFNIRKQVSIHTCYVRR